jgi:phosphonate transport system substrate-binding protein
MSEREPELVAKTRVVYRSERLGFPPIVCLKNARDTETAEGISKAFLDMRLDALGQKILATLNLDGFVAATPDLYSATLEKWLVVKAQA